MAVLGNLEDLVSLKNAPVAQLDRANASGALGREFESLRAHHPIHFNSRRVSFEERLSVLDAGAFAQGSNARKNRELKILKWMVDAVGIEPTTCRLRAECSAS